MKPTAWSPGDRLREALGDPRAARVDADELRVEGNRAAHALGERGERLFGVRQGQGIRSAPDRRTRPAG